jgi:glycosyltransferase involved in cell wall biosynthesis
MRTSPSLTDWPSSQRISFTTPSSSASTGISIFIDSRMTTESPSDTLSPTATSIFQTLPVMCASMSAMAGDNSPTMDAKHRAGDEGALAVVVAARNEADRVGETVRALRGAFPAARIWVADDGSSDGTAEAAMVAGAEVVRRGRPHGKGGNVTAAAEAALGVEPPPRVVLLCDGDLATSAARLAPLVEAVRGGECDVAVASFHRRVGGGFGIALSFARWAIRRLCGLETEAPISGQRALRVEALRATLPFAAGYGMEIGMTVDAVRAGYRLWEYELDLEHRATGRNVRGFLHRAGQLRDFLRVFIVRLGPPR